MTTGVRAALDDVAEIGPFFAASANPAEEVDPSWRPLRVVYADPGILAARIELVAAALGTSDRRVAASVAFQGLAARLVSPVLATAAVHRLVPPWTPETLHWRPAVSGPWPLWESRGESVNATPGVVAATVVQPHLAALVDATRVVESVSARVLWGNAASALAAAAVMVARARPAAAGRAGAIVGEALHSAPLADAGRFERRWSFRRRSCCLYYRLPGGEFCGDCVLVRG